MVHQSCPKITKSQITQLQILPDSVLHLKKFLQFAREYATQLLPCEHLAAGSQFCMTNTTHDRVPGLKQVWPPGIGNHTEIRAGRMSSQHIANELIRKKIVSTRWQRPHVKYVFQIAIGFNHSSRLALEIRFRQLGLHEESAELHVYFRAIGSPVQ